MPLPSHEALASSPTTIVVFGPSMGESIVVRTESEETGPIFGVIDSARREFESSSVNPALEMLKKEDARPTFVALTHPHSDHSNGLADIIEWAGSEATIGCVEPLLSRPSPFAAAVDPDDLMSVSRSQNVVAHTAILRAWANGARKMSFSRDSTFSLGDWKLRVLHPSENAIDDAMERYKDEKHVNLNDLSASMLLTKDERSFVLGADGEFQAWNAVKSWLSPNDLLAAAPVKVPHHGSKNAIHPVLIDSSVPNLGRKQVVTPFPSSGRLPRFEAGGGADELLQASGEFELTAMPVDLIPDRRSREAVTFKTARNAFSTAPFAGDGDIAVRTFSSSGNLVEAKRDPRETWILFGLEEDGSVTTERGLHSMKIVK